MKKISVLDVCKVTSTTLVLRSAPLWNKRPENTKYKTMFLDTISGRFLGENKNYVDDELPENITFPDMGINLRAISGQPISTNKKTVDSGNDNEKIKVAQISHRGFVYQDDFSASNFSRVSPSLKLNIEEYEKAFRGEIEKNEGGEPKEQGAVVIFNNETMPDLERHTISAAYLPDTINRVTDEKATTESLAALLFTVDMYKATFLLPDVNVDDPVFQNALQQEGISENDIIVPPDPFSKTRLWDLALHVYQILNNNLYSLKPSENILKAAEKYASAFGVFARLKGSSVISISHTHPGQMYKGDFSTNFTVGAPSTFKKTTLSQGDFVLVKRNKLPDLIFVFRWKGNKNQKLEEAVVLWASAISPNDVKKVCKTKEDFFRRRNEILFESLLSHYPLLEVH